MYVTDLPMWPMLTSAKTWPGHQVFWPPHNDVYPRSFLQHEYSKVLLSGELQPLIGGLPEIESMNWVSLLLNCLRSWMEFKWCDIALHNKRPCSANELSNRVRYAALLDLLLGGITAELPSLGRGTKGMLRLLLVWALRIFHIIDEKAFTSSRRDISEKQDTRYKARSLPFSGIAWGAHLLFCNPQPLRTEVLN